MHVTYCAGTVTPHSLNLLRLLLLLPSSSHVPIRLILLDALGITTLLVLSSQGEQAGKREDMSRVYTRNDGVVCRYISR